jgi:hypothetical protein
MRGRLNQVGRQPRRPGALHDFTPEGRQGWPLPSHLNRIKPRQRAGIRQI